MDKFVTQDHFDQYTITLRSERMDALKIEATLVDIKEFFGWVRQEEKIDDMRKIKLELLDEFRGHLRDKQLSPGEVERRVEKVKRFFKWLKENQIIKNDPFEEDGGLEANLGILNAKEVKKSNLHINYKVAGGLFGAIVVVALVMTFKPWTYFDYLLFGKDALNSRGVDLAVEPRQIVVEEEKQQPTVKTKGVPVESTEEEFLPEVGQQVRYNFGILLAQFAADSKPIESGEGEAEVYLVDAVEIESWWKRLWKVISGQYQEEIADTQDSTDSADEFISPVDVPVPDLSGGFEIKDEELFENEAAYKRDVNEFLNASKEVIEVLTDDNGISFGFIDTSSEYAVLLEPVVGMSLYLKGQTIPGADFHETYIVPIGVNQNTDGYVTYGSGEASVEYSLNWDGLLGESVSSAISEFDETYTESIGQFVHTVVVVTYDDANGNHVWDEGESVLPLEGLKVRLVKVK